MHRDAERSNRCGAGGWLRSGDLAQPDILGVVGEERLPPAGELAQGVMEHLPIGAGGQRVLRNPEPLGDRRRYVGETGEPREEGARPRCPHAPFFTRAGEPRPTSHEGRRELCVRPLELPSDRLEILIGQPHAERRPPVVVPGQLVVETETLRAGSHETKGDPIHVRAEPLADRRGSDVPVIRLGQLEAVHCAASPRVAVSRSRFCRVACSLGSLLVSA